MAENTFYARLMGAFGEKFPGLPTTQKSVGKQLGIDQSDLSRYKTGDRLPTLERSITLATELEVSVEWLLTGRGPRKPLQTLPPGIEELLDFWDKLPPEAQRDVIGYAKITRATTPTTGPERLSEAHRRLSEGSGKKRRKIP